MSDQPDQMSADTDHWMGRLGAHYRQMRERYPNEPLIVLFDIDGTILDMRHAAREVLHRYDREHGTELFRDLRIDEIDVHEARVGPLLERRGIGAERTDHIIGWVEQNLWEVVTTLENPRAFHGVLDVIRWFELQPNTEVGLNTGRPEPWRKPTLATLTAVGRDHRVRFTSEMLFMNPDDRRFTTAEGKVLGVRRFEEQGLRVVAMIDNEPANLEAIAVAAPQVLLLHADTIFDSLRSRLPVQAVGGDRYELSPLSETLAPDPHIQLVWHGVNQPQRFVRFIESGIRWAELDVHREPATGRVLVRDRPLSEEDPVRGEAFLPLKTCLRQLRSAGRCAKLDLEDESVVAPVLAEVESSGIADRDIWFAGRIERLGDAGFRRLREARPRSVIQCPIDFLAPLIRALPVEARRILDTIAAWGIDRVGVNWQTPDKRFILDKVEQWGFGTTIDGVPNLEEYLRACLLQPTSICAAFELEVPGLENTTVKTATENGSGAEGDD